MAKSTKTFDRSNLLKTIQKFSPFANTIDKSESAKSNDWMHSGNYMLNAILSGSLKRGVSCNRSTIFAGESGSGKTYLCMNLASNFQKSGYDVYYLDTEGAITEDLVASFKMDVNTFFHIPCSDLLALKSIVANLIDTYKTNKIEGVEMPKCAIFIDSLGMIASSKELDDALSGSDKRDMTKAQMIRSFFRLVSADLTSLGIPLIITNHIVTDVGSMFPQFTQSGGLGVVYAASSIIGMTKAKLKDDKGDAGKQTGVIVTVKAEKNRFAKPEKAKIHIHYTKGMNPYVGLEEFVSWESCGIQKGNILTEKDYQKLSTSDKAKCYEFTNSENVIVYFSPKDTARNYIVKHLGRAIDNKEFFTSLTFTDAVLDELDEKVIKPKFAYGKGGEEDILIEDEEIEENT